MPDFSLSVQERLALTLYLSVQEEDLQEPLGFSALLPREKPALRHEEVVTLIAKELKCVSCHQFQGKGGDRAGELLDLGWRLKSDWLVRYLALPQAFEAHSAMPAFFYTRSTDRQQLVETIPEAGKKLLSLVVYFDSVGADRRDRAEREFETARATNPSVTAAIGEKIFIALNCAACHQHQSIKSRHNAPTLSNEGERVQREWLQSYLAKPTPIRPFGFYPGTGGRMPDYRLSSEERALLSEYFSSQAPKEKKYQLKQISRFSATKAEAMLRDKLPCLGCHSLRGEGGRVAPELAKVKMRLQPSFVLAMIREPEKAVANSIMPKTPLTVSEQELIVNYLFQIESPDVGSAYLSLVENPTLQRVDTTTVAGLYTRYCSPCHGEFGNGDGFNAKYLPVKPAAHGSSLAMESRPDGTLFDGIHSGGAILNKSHRMPAFGGTLSRVQIESLVRYIRDLCHCEGPAWSRK